MVIVDIIMQEIVMVNEKNTLPIAGGVGASFKISSSFNFVNDIVSPSLLACARPRDFCLFFIYIYIYIYILYDPLALFACGRPRGGWWMRMQDAAVGVSEDILSLPISL
jgi:hypothetical protein